MHVTVHGLQQIQKEIDAENIKIYPKPTTNLVWIDGVIDQDIAYELHSTTGKTHP